MGAEIETLPFTPDGAALGAAAGAAGAAGAAAGAAGAAAGAAGAAAVKAGAEETVDAPSSTCT